MNESNTRISQPKNTSNHQISRRDFLKLSSTGFLSLLISHQRDIQEPKSIQFGRITQQDVPSYDVPSFQGNVLKVYSKDQIFPITSITLGDDEKSHNQVWYYVEDQGYIHSGSVQPVRYDLNPVETNIAKTGVLTEVTVPYTDSYHGVGKDTVFAYRLYYETVHWVYALRYSQLGEPWYQIRDDRWKYNYYVPASHLRIVPPIELAPISSFLPNEAKRIEVQMSEQILTAYEWGQSVFMTRVSTGTVNRDGRSITPIGHFSIYYKRPSRHMAINNLALTGYDLPGVPWVCYFSKSGIAFHGTYWHSSFGQPVSHGCVNLTPKAARWIYRWTDPVVPSESKGYLADAGTTVDIFP